MRALFLSHGSALTGAELSLVDAVRALTAQAVETQVALPGDGPLEQRLRQLGVDVTVAPQPWDWWVTEGPLDLPRRVWQGLGFLARSRPPLTHLRTTIRHLRPDVVVTNTLTFPHGAVAARLESVPHVWNVREFGREDHGLRHLFGDGFSLKLMGALSSRVVACSEAVAEKLSGHVRPGKIRVVYSAVDVPELSPPMLRAGGPLHLLTLARLHPGKGQEDSIRATAILAERGLDVELSLVGSLPPDTYRSTLAQLAARSPARGRVTFHDFTAAPQAHLARCDVLLVTARSEAFPRAIVEAMKSGRPVVAARSGGSIELVRDGWNGLLYRPGDADDLARQIARLYEDRALGAAIALRGQEWARETFTLERHGADLLRVLTEAARSVRGRRGQSS